MAETAIIGGLAAGSVVTGLINASNENDLKQQSSAINRQWNLQNAELSLKEAAEDERRIRIQERQQLGDMQANYSKSGITMEGSPLDVMQKSASNAELDALTVRHQGAIKAWGYQQQAWLDEFEGQASSSLLPGKVAGSVFNAGLGVATHFYGKRTS